MDTARFMKNAPEASDRTAIPRKKQKRGPGGGGRGVTWRDESSPLTGRNRDMAPTFLLRLRRLAAMGSGTRPRRGRRPARGGHALERRGGGGSTGRQPASAASPGQADDQRAVDRGELLPGPLVPRRSETGQEAEPRRGRVVDPAFLLGDSQRPKEDLGGPARISPGRTGPGGGPVPPAPRRGFAAPPDSPARRRAGADVASTHQAAIDLVPFAGIEQDGAEPRRSGCARTLGRGELNAWRSTGGGS